MAKEKNPEDKNVWLFDGSKPGDLKGWKKWAASELLNLANAVKVESWGTKVYSWLRGDALEAFDSYEPEDFFKVDGHKGVFEVLEERYPLKTNLQEKSRGRPWMSCLSSRPRPARPLRD